MEHEERPPAHTNTHWLLIAGHFTASIVFVWNKPATSTKIYDITASNTGKRQEAGLLILDVK